MRPGHQINLRSSLWRGRRIGLLGGSFNPAHRGHLMISRQAIRHLRLDEIWWLVSPQNPLKPTQGMAGLKERLAAAANCARDPRIRVSGLEQEIGTQYTADTLAALRRRCPRSHFVWLMGADNLIQMPRWRAWREIMALTPIAIFGRTPYSLGAMTSQAAKKYGRYRYRASAAPTIVTAVPPAWTFIHYQHDTVSATELRAATAPD